MPGASGCSRVTYTDLEPSQAIRPQRLGISKLQQAPRQVCPQVVQVGVHGVGPPPEVQVVWEVEPILIHVIICYLKKKKECFTCMPAEKASHTHVPPEEEKDGKLHMHATGVTYQKVITGSPHQCARTPGGVTELQHKDA